MLAIKIVHGKYLSFAFAMWLVTSAQLLEAASPLLSNVSVSTDDATKRVTITYRLDDPDSAVVHVSMQVSTNAGASYTIQPLSFEAGSAVGSVSPGENKRIIWLAGTDWPNQVTSQMRVKLTANDNPTPAGMSLIPAGEFVMGDAMGDGYSSDELPLHTNTISAFYMDRYEVTKALWDDVYSWASTNGYSFGSVGPGKASNHPVHSVDWYDAIAWCNARSEREGLTPCYTNANGTVYKNASGNSFDGGCNWSAGGYRLPTEAEWEKAARGGVAGQRFPWGNTIAHSNANYYSWSGYAYDISSTRNYHPTFNDSTTPFTSPVGYFAPNGYGLYDMSGNVWEWCWDWYGGNYYSSSPPTDPRGPSTGSYGSRVLRGGSWYYYAYYTRVAYRDYITPDNEFDNIGFRCARGL